MADASTSAGIVVNGGTTPDMGTVARWLGRYIASRYFPQRRPAKLEGFRLSLLNLQREIALLVSGSFWPANPMEMPATGSPFSRVTHP